MGGVRWGGGAAQRNGQGQSLTSLGGVRACAGDARMETASTHGCSLRRVSLLSSHGRLTGCSWAQCLEEGRKAREMMSENNQGKQTNLGIKFVFCFCSAQKSIIPHTQSILQNYSGTKLQMDQSMGKRLMFCAACMLIGDMDRQFKICVYSELKNHAINSAYHTGS